MADDDGDGIENDSDQDVDFVGSMHKLLGMDDDAVNEVLEKLDADELQSLTDAVAKGDRETAEQVISQAHTEDEVNALFRGENLKAGEQRKRTRKPNDGSMQFAIGDDVLVNIKGKDGKKHSVSATVAKPNGPQGTDTVVVKIKGKWTVVERKNLDKLEENIIGMIGFPNVNRIQQLAGIQSPGMGMPSSAATPPQAMPELIAPEPIPEEPAPDDALGQAMAAFNTLEAALPNITLADLKCVRERLTALQTSMNESANRRTLTRKHAVQTLINESSNQLPRRERKKLLPQPSLINERVNLGRARKL